MSKSIPPIKSKPIIKHLRFELDGKTYTAFWDVGINILNLRTKDEILKELIRIVKEKYPNEK